MQPALVFCAPAPVVETPEGFELDIKFVDGMRAHIEGWGGPIRCVLWRGSGPLPFGRMYQRGDLVFDLIVLDPGAPLPPEVMQGAGMAMVSADMPQFPALAGQLRAAGLPVVAALEYTLETRLQIIALDPALGVARKMKRRLRCYWNEMKMRRALRSVAGVQFNGFPAYDRYASTVRQPMLYLDNRMSAGMMASPAEMAARAARLRAGAPLRLIHSGRLEPMKGAQDLLPVMRALQRQGVAATLDIYGTGSLEAEIRAGLSAFGGAVRLHGPVDFETELVPISRTGADIFLSCHRQSDPSCTYVEALGCGLALAGYDNRMWARLSAEVGVGAVAPLGQPEALAGLIARWDHDREALIDAAQRGLGYAQHHEFEQVFAARMAHLRACAARL